MVPAAGPAGVLLPLVDTLGNFADIADRPRSRPPLDCHADDHPADLVLQVADPPPLSGLHPGRGLHEPPVPR